MTLLDEIIELASSEHGSVSTLLRRCLVLAHFLKNDRLKAWAENELNGYGSTQDETIPAYRKISAPAKGLLLGAFGAVRNDQPIPSGLLDEEDRHRAESAVFFQPIAAFEANPIYGGYFSLPWPSNLVLKYERIFSDYALNKAWQVIPNTVIAGLVDTIKTRVLLFALELKDDVESVNNDFGKVAKEKVEKNIVINILGGNNVVASCDVTQVSNVIIEKGDWNGLDKALKEIGLKATEISELKVALKEDETIASKPTFGERTLTWIKGLGTMAGGLAVKIGADAIKEVVTKLINGFLGA